MDFLRWSCELMKLGVEMRLLVKPGFPDHGDTPAGRVEMSHNLRSHKASKNLDALTPEKISAAVQQCATDLGLDLGAILHGETLMPVQFWAHPESDCVFVTLADESPGDGVDGAHCHPISEAEYFDLRTGGAV